MPTAPGCSSVRVRDVVPRPLETGKRLGRRGDREPGGLFIIFEPGYRRSGAVMTQAGRGTVMAWSGSPDWKRRLAVQHADHEGQTREQARPARDRQQGRQGGDAAAQQQAAAAKTAEVARPTQEP